jgi:hypothetical protein
MDESLPSPCLASSLRSPWDRAEPRRVAVQPIHVVSHYLRSYRRHRCLPPPPTLTLGIEWRFLCAANATVLSLASVSFPGAWSGSLFPGHGRSGRPEFTGIFTGPTQPNSLLRHKPFLFLWRIKIFGPERPFSGLGSAQPDETLRGQTAVWNCDQVFLSVSNYLQLEPNLQNDKVHD